MGVGTHLGAQREWGSQGAEPSMASAGGDEGRAAWIEGGARSTGVGVTPPGYTPRSASQGRLLCVHLTAGTFYWGEGFGAAVWMAS